MNAPRLTLPDVSNPDIAPIVAEQENHLVAGDDGRGSADQRAITHRQPRDHGTGDQATCRADTHTAKNVMRALGGETPWKVHCDRYP